MSNPEARTARAHTLEIAQAKVLGAIDDSRAAVASVSRKIWERPETGGLEIFASSIAMEALRDAGFEVEGGFCGIPTAFLARRSRSADGHARPRIAFMAEYDALPELGHACGHNLICASALAAGIGLAAAGAEGEVLVYGTPAEETNGAKTAMAAAGLFDGVDAALMIHPYAGNYLYTEALALDGIEIAFSGRSAHAAAAPWEGRSALDAVIMTFNAVNALRQTMRPEARIHGVITDGGAAPNIVPERSSARFYVRARSRSYLDELAERFRDCARGAALATGTELAIAGFEASFDDMLNNRTLAERFRDHIGRFPGSRPFRSAPDSFGSIDMGNVSKVVPAIHVLIDIADGREIGLHTREFRELAGSAYAEEATIRAAKALALTGLDAMSDPGFLAAARAEFDAATGRSKRGTTEAP
jgi:amidohydrolase